MNIKRLVRNLVAVTAIAFAAATGQAAIINITNHGGSLVGDVNMNAVLGNNNPTTNFNWLVGVVDGYNTITSSSLAAPVYAGFLDAGTTNPFDLTGYAYAVLHYGAGQGGSPSGGIVAYYLNGETSVSFLTKGLGPNGKGGLSSVRLYKANETTTKVPDASATAVLFALGMLGVGAAVHRRR